MPKENAKLITKSRLPGQMSDLYDNHGAPERFADGVGQMLIGAAVTRVGFFVTEGFEQDADGTSFEVRSIDNKLIIPTSSLIEWAAGLLVTVVENREHLSKASQSAEIALENAIEALAKAKKG